MKNRIKLTVIAVLLSSSIAFAANEGGKKEAKTSTAAAVCVTGQVIDQNTGEALTGVLVKLDNTDKETYTDFDGKFTFENVVPGEYNLVAKMISYNLYVDKNVKVKKADQNTVKVALKKY